MERKAAFIFVLAVAAVCLWMHLSADYSMPRNTSGEYYVDNSIHETSALNAVTAIYLNYRVYDTLFETLTLLLSVTGVIYLSRHGGLHDEK